MSAEVAADDCKVRESKGSKTTFCSPPTNTRLEPGDIRAFFTKKTSVEALLSCILTLTDIFEDSMFATEIPITVEVVKAGVV